MQGGLANPTMSTQREEGLGMLAYCAIVIVLSLAGLVAAFLTRLVTSIDGLLLLMICLMMGGLFSLMLFLTARDEGWLPSRHKKQEASAPAANPGPAKTGEGK
jgi:hypothetical protein